MMEKISEKNILEKMNVYHSETKSWFKTLKLIRKEIDAIEELYDSIRDNYISLFIYHALEQKISSKDFDSLMPELYKQIGKDGTGDPLFRFFSFQSTNVHPKGYFKFPEKNDISIWDDIYYCFMEFEKDKCFLRKDRLPHLLSLIENIPQDKIGYIYSAGFTHYCGHFLNNLEELEPIFNLKNPALKLKNPKVHLDLLGHILKLWADESYSKTDIENREMYLQFKLRMPNMEQIFLDMTYDFNNKDRSINGSFVNWARFTDIDIINPFIQCYKNSYCAQNKVEMHNDNQRIKVIEDLINKFSPRVYFESGFNFYDINTIEPDKSLMYNYLSTHLLLLKFKTGDVLDIPLNTLNYLNQELKNISKDKGIHDWSLNYHLKDLAPYIEKLILEHKLPEKTITTKKTKI